MRKRWEFEPKNIFSELLILLGRITQENLTYQIQYLKVENEILRKRIGKFIRPTPAERNRLLKFGAPLGKRIKDIITIVRYRTFLKWGRIPREQKSEKSNKRGRPKTIKETCELVVRLAKENAWGYVRILGELRKLGLHRLSKSSVKNILKENNLAPSPERSRDSWDCFIKRHFQTLWACDFFTKQVLTPLGPKMFFILFFINIKTRKVHIGGLTQYPSQKWVNKHTKDIMPIICGDKDSKNLL